RQRDDLARTHADVHQALDRPQLLGLRRRVLALAVVVARGLRESVAALPHPQYVLRQARLAFDGADVLGQALAGVLIHRVSSDCAGSSERVSYPAYRAVQDKR